MRSIVLPLVVAVTVSSCLISGDNFGARFCKKNDDCPGVAGYICASTGSWPQRGCGEGEDACLCEVRFPPEPGGISIDGGTPVLPDAGPPPDYCTEIKPIISLNCLGTCHGDQMGYPNSPPDFRLDYWEPGPQHAMRDGGAGLPGVKARVDAIARRIYDEKTMPPNDFGIFPSQAERALVNRWVRKFGAPRGSGNCEEPMTPDAGRADAGPGGTDGGPPVRFSTDVVPIFQARCGPCHTTNTSGGLSLTAANAYNQLVNVQVSAGCAPAGTPRMRVQPNNPNMSQLFLKTSDAANKCGNFMPRNPLMPLNVLAPAQFSTIERWIRQGAPNN